MTTFTIYGSVFCLAALIVLVRQIFRRVRARRERQMREETQRMIDYSEMPAPHDEVPRTSPPQSHGYHIEI